MDTVFLSILNRSIAAGWLVLLIALLRLIWRRAPKQLWCLLWGLVGFRLIYPFSIVNPLSLIPSASTFSHSDYDTVSPLIESGFDGVDTAVNSMLSQAQSGMDFMQTAAVIGGVIWVIGVAAMLIHSLIRYVQLHNTVQEGFHVQENIYLCDHISTAFIFGIVKPRIYLPSSIQEEDIFMVVTHERMHLKRLDHIWKPLGFVLLCVYWINPLMWLGYSLFCRDIELACDAKVLQKWGNEWKKPYSTALIHCSAPQKVLSACPLAFGETAVKDRIKSILRYKDPTFWIIAASVVGAIVCIICFATDPVSNDLDAYISEVIIAEEKPRFWEGELCTESHKILGTRNIGNQTTVYMLSHYGTYGYEDGSFEYGGGGGALSITVERNGDSYSLVEYCHPYDKLETSVSERAKFPWYIKKDWYTDDLWDELIADDERKALEYFGISPEEAFPYKYGSSPTVPTTSVSD